MREIITLTSLRLMFFLVFYLHTKHLETMHGISSFIISSQRYIKYVSCFIRVTCCIFFSITERNRIRSIQSFHCTPFINITKAQAILMIFPLHSNHSSGVLFFYPMFSFIVFYCSCCCCCCFFDAL